MSSPVDLAIRVTSDARKGIAGIDQTTKRAQRMGKVGSLAGKALAGGLAAGAVGAFKLAQGAAEDAAAASKLAQAAKQSANATDKQVASMENWISAAGKAFGVTDDELRPALTQLVTATHSVRKAQKLAGLAMNISARSGKSLQSVSAALAKAQTTGNVAALAKYGVATKDAHGKTKSLEQVTRELAKTYKGSAAASADTIAGKWARAKLQLSELGESIGYKLIPAMAKAAEYGLKAVQWIEDNQRTVTYLVAALGSLLAIVWAVSTAYKAWQAVTKTITIVQTVLNAVLAANPVVLITLAVVALAAALYIAYQRSDRFRAIADAAFRVVQKAAAFAFNWIRGHWKLLFVILTGPVGAAVLLIVKYRTQIMNAIGAAIAWIRAHWKVIFVILTGGFGLAVLTIIKHRDRILSVIGSAVAWIREHWSTIEGILTAPFHTAAAAAQKVVDIVEKIISTINKIPSIPHPDLNPFGRVGGSGGKSSLIGGRSTGTPTVTNNYNVDMSGLLSSDQAVAQFLKLLRANARRTGGTVVIKA